jgi:mannitol/fructose-specific phosphotransferase system IIA component (Ntr-type)
VERLVGLTDLFVCTAVLDGGPLLGKATLVQQLLTRLAKAGHFPDTQVPAVLAAVLRREQLGSTGIGCGVAVPHTRHAAVPRPLGVLAVCRQPVGFDALDGEPVDLVALCLFPPDRPGDHLGEVSRRSAGLSRHLADADFCRRLRQATSAEEIAELVEMEGRGMTRREWAACTDPAAMLRLLRDRGLLSERKARLFGAACCRRLWGLLPSEGRRAVEVVERHADGLAGGEERDAARRAFTAGLGAGSGPASFAAIAVSYLLAEAGPDPAGHALDLGPWAAQAGGDQAGERAAQTGILRCLFGSPPFRAGGIRPGWLAFGGGVVANLARGISDERAFDRLPILADALEEAGCASPELLGHCRSAGPHARGCWAVDLILGKG